jgi:hypothetical protein
MSWKGKRMHLKLTAIVGLLSSSLLFGGVKNPVDFSFDFALSSRYYNPDGTVYVGTDPQDVLVTPLAEQLPAGSYDVYIRVGVDRSQSSKRLLELAIGDSVQPIVYQKPSQLVWIGPISFKPSYAVDRFHLHGPVKEDFCIDKFQILPVGSKVPEGVTPVVSNGTEKDWQTVLIDFPTIHKAPAWYTPDLPVQVRVRAALPAKTPVSIDCHILDYDHQEVAKYSFTIATTGEASFEKMETIPVPINFGPYLLRFLGTLPNGKKFEFQRIAARVDSPLEFTTDRWGGHGNAPLLRRMGAGWNRLHDCGGRAVVSWECVEPEKGKFTWRDADIPGPGIKNLGVIEGGPEWAKDARDSSDWLNYIRQMVSHYKGNVPAWEIYNEPYDTPTETFAKKHVARVAAAAKVIREANPAAIITSGGPPEEIPPGLGWWEVLLKHGLVKPLDTISVHAYFGGGGTCPVDGDLRFDEYITALRKLCDQYGGKGKPLWDTESGLCPMESFYIGRDVVYGIWGNSGLIPRSPVPYHDAAAMDARYLMLHFWHNIRWNYYHTSACWSNHWSLCDYDQTPLPAAVTMAQMTRLLRTAEADGKPTLPKGLWGLRFKNNGQTVVAFWATFLKLGESRFLLGFKSDPQVRILDMFANPVVPTQKHPIGVAPIILSGPAGAIEKVLAGLSVTSEMDPNAGPRKANQRLTDPKRNPPAKLTTGSKEAEEQWFEYEWPRQVTINRLICAWPADEIPLQYKVEWFDGLNWHPCSGTPDWRTAVLAKEDYTIDRVKTQRLRTVIRPKKGQPAKITEFDAFYHPRLTPPVSEMQEIWTRTFSPSPKGYIKDWLVCGPFPAPGLRYDSTGKPPNWDHDFLDVCWIYGRGLGEPVIQPKVEQEHHAFFPAGTKAPWKAMDVVVAWQPLHAGDNGRVDLAKVFKNNILYDREQIVEQSFGYAACYLDLPTDIKGFISIGSDDGYKIWIDDKVAAENVVFRGAIPDQERYPVNVAKGKHRILVKLHNDIVDHEFYFRFLDKNEKPIQSYTVHLTP